MRVDLGAQGAQLGFRDLLEQHRFAALALDGFALAVQRVEAVAALGADDAKIVQIVGHQSRPRGAG